MRIKRLHPIFTARRNKKTIVYHHFIHLGVLFVLTTVSFSAFAQTQSDMNQDSCSEYKRIDRQLNETYQRILKEYAGDAVFITRMKEAQRAWLKFRDAHVESMFPKRDKRVAYGSVYPMCNCSALTAITRQRVEQLSVWVNGIPEGDVCSGSVKLK
jgi:uncharacterized protein YecT (DUF1311 family)